MLGVVIINTTPINTAGSVKVHLAHGSVRPAALKVRAATTRTQVMRGRATAQALVDMRPMSATLAISGEALAAATFDLHGVSRGHTVTGRSVASVVKVVASSSVERFVGLLQPKVKATAAPPHMLINAAYYVISALGVCMAAATARLNVVKHAAGYFYNPARAVGTRAQLSARRRLRVEGFARATVTGNRAVRLARLAGRGIARVTTSTPVTVALRGLRAAAQAAATPIRAVMAFSQIVEYVQAVVRATVAAPVRMVTWMYVHEPDYRTVFVRNDASTTRMRMFRKQPAEVLPYDIDFAQWLAPLHGDDIESAQVSVVSAINGDPADLNIDNVVIIIKNPMATMDVEPVRVKVWLSGGVHGATYKITARVDTEGGRRKEVDFRLSVREV